MLSLEAVPRLEALFASLGLGLGSARLGLGLGLGLEGYCLGLGVFVLAHTVLLTSRGFDNLTI